MVTHDPRYARHAQRTIHLFDGKIVEGVATSTSTAQAQVYGASSL
jgi:putative ABC transport system ATP-binding protein